ncbi:MAG: plastocyanin/azurin family copper-binding protein, partial [Pseudomonadota bacterium]
MNTRNDAVYLLVALVLFGLLAGTIVLLPFMGKPGVKVTDKDKPTAQTTVSQSVVDQQPPQPVEEPKAETTEVAEEVVNTGTVHTIKMLNSGEDGSMVFEPGYLLAQPGDTVVFEPADMAHNTKSVLVPDGAEPWQSNLNEGITLTLNEEGIYLYLCEPHSALAMAGVIQVGEAVNLEAARAKAEELNQTVVLGKERLTNYLDRVEGGAASAAVADKVESEIANREEVVDGETKEHAGDGADDSGETAAAATEPAELQMAENAATETPVLEGQSEATGVSNSTHIIKMLNAGSEGSMVFEPGFILAEPGDTVVFEPVDMAHNTKSVLVPDGAEPWHGALNEGISLTLTEEGVYLYVCEPHSPLAMAGVIQVGSAVNLDAARAKAEELNQSVVLGKNRLFNYLDIIVEGSEENEVAAPVTDGVEREIAELEETVYVEASESTGDDAGNMEEVEESDDVVAATDASGSETTATGKVVDNNSAEDDVVVNEGVEEAGDTAAVAEEVKTDDAMTGGDPATDSANDESEKATDKVSNDSESSVVAIADNTPQQPAAPVTQEIAVSGVTHVVRMLDYGENGLLLYEPGFISAQPGDTIIFETDGTGHNTRSVLVPDGAEQWQGKLDEEVTLTLREEGIYIYICEPHSLLAMVGVIQVGEAYNLQAARAKVRELNATFVVAKDRLNDYMEMVQ